MRDKVKTYFLAKLAKFAKKDKIKLFLNPRLKDFLCALCERPLLTLISHFPGLRLASLNIVASAKVPSPTPPLFGGVRKGEGESSNKLRNNELAVHHFATDTEHAH